MCGRGRQKKKKRGAGWTGEAGQFHAGEEPIMKNEVKKLKPGAMRERGDRAQEETEAGGC